MRRRVGPCPRRASAALAAALLLLAPGALTGCAARLAAPEPLPSVPPGHTAEVSRLASPDFVERARAAERLVALGEEALPALGLAGDVEVAVLGGGTVRPNEPVIRSILAALPAEQAAVHLSSRWPAVRRVAAEDAGERGRWVVVPRLIEMLEDIDEGVRGAAAASLRRLTNEFIPYHERSNAKARAASARRWQAWWNAVGRLRAARRDESTESP